jgi:hypothetical protein
MGARVFVIGAPTGGADGFGAVVCGAVGGGTEAVSAAVDARARPRTPRR